MSRPERIEDTAEEIVDGARKGNVILPVVRFEEWRERKLPECPWATYYAGARGHWIRAGALPKREAIKRLEAMLGKRATHRGEEVPDFGTT